MCVTCGCGEPGEVHAHPPTTDVLAIEERVLAHNDHLAAHNRAWLERRGILDDVVPQPCVQKLRPGVGIVRARPLDPAQLLESRVAHPGVHR